MAVPDQRTPRWAYTKGVHQNTQDPEVSQGVKVDLHIEYCGRGTG